MKNKIKDVFTSQSFLGYVEDTIPELVAEGILEPLFPMKTIDGLDYSYVKSSNGAVELTSPSAFDSEPIAQNREGFDAFGGEMPLFRKKMNLTEKEKYQLNLYLRASDDAGISRLLSQIYDDQTTLITGSLMTMEFLRARALMDGKITMQSKGGAVAIDYKIPAANKYVLSGSAMWSDPAAKIIDDLQGKLDKVEDVTGVRPSRILMNRKTFRMLRDNTQIRTNLVPLGVMASASVQSNAVINDAQIMATFKMLTGITDVIVYNKKVKLDGQVLDLIEDNKVAIFPSDSLGNTLIGTSPAELNAGEANAAGGQVAVTGEGIAINVINKNEAPYTSETQVEFIGIPSFPQSDKVILMTVHS